MESNSYLHCESVSHKYNDCFLFENLSFNLHNGAKLGIIGENGSGKSTLLSILSSTIDPIKGDIRYSEKPVLIPQEIGKLDERKTLGDYIDECLKYSTNIIQKIEYNSEIMASGGENMEILSHLLEEADRKEVWSARSRMEKYIFNFGLQNLGRDKLINNFSAGQKKRIVLCLETFMRPNILILDEPSNYLDKKSRNFLIKELKNMKGVVIFASHDREFLSLIPNSICDIDKNWSSPYVYKGNYADYVKQKNIEYQKWVDKFNHQEEKLKELQNILDTRSIKVGQNSLIKDNNKLGYKARGERVDAQLSKKYRAIKESIKSIQNSYIPIPSKPLNLSFPLPVNNKLDHDTIMSLVDVKVKGRLEGPVNINLKDNSKLIILGPNGSGKTTLLDILSKKINITSGKFNIYKESSVSYMSHEDIYQEDFRSAREIYECSVSEPKKEISDLGILNDVTSPVSSLSRGQRKRLELAILLQNAPGVIYMDEPTNHLSLLLCEELFPILTRWPGCVVIATHDPFVISMSGWEHYEVAI